MSNWHFDDGHHFDEGHSVVISADGEMDVEHSYGHVLFTDATIDIIAEFEVDFFIGVPLDLMPLFPEKFRNTEELGDPEILREYVEEFGIQVGVWLNAVQDIVQLLNPNTIYTNSYIRNLGALIGVSFPDEDDTDEAELIRVLSQAVDWYKVKGTYESIDIIALASKLTMNIWDMYTNDYVSFHLTDWFVGGENENPPGYDNTYFKSPHFGAEVVLNKKYLIDSQYYLWSSELNKTIVRMIDETRPVHTVPHFMILLNPQTDEFGNVITVSGDIQTRVLDSWEISTGYFDEGTWTFDDPVDEWQWDLTAETFIKSVTKWVLGSGGQVMESSGISGTFSGSLYDSGFDIMVPEIEGTIDPDDIIIGVDKIIFEFVVPKAIEADGLNELGLYIPGTPDTIVIGSVFPKINKTDDAEMRVLVEVWKKDLS